MLGEEEDDKITQPPPPPPAAGGDNRRIYSRSVSWAAGRSPTKSTPANPKSLWNNKARGCLPPLSVSRPKAQEWPRAGSDDLGVWPNVVAATTPGVRPRPPALPLNFDKSLSKPPREFEFKKDKLAFFDKECSRIIDHVFLGSDAVAKNRDVLRQNGITHVLNCVGFVCPEYFKNELVYKTLWLQDSPSEDITSILYDVFDYFEDVRERNGRVFVHCCQGVSRSTSLVIAYLMWQEGHSFEDAFQQVKAARGVTNPNMGFASQLLQCQKRVHAVPVSPSSVLRMYRMAPHSSYAPLHLVPKLLARPNVEALDSRGAFIVNVPSAIYVWIGKDCDLLMYESARLAASQVIRYEKANGPALTIREGKEPIEFWDLFGNDQERFTGDIGIPGQRKVADYDIDFGVFDKAANSGVVPPLSISGKDSEMCLPARQSGWERLRRKFVTGVMKELITSSKEVEFFESPCDSPDSCSLSDISASRDWVKTTDSKGTEDDNSECLSAYSFSSFLVKDSRKFDNNTSPSLSPSTSDYSNSFSFSPTSSNWSDLSVSAQPSPSGLETSDPSLDLNPNSRVREISPSAAEIPRNLGRTWSFSIEDEAMEDAEDESLADDDEEGSMFDAENNHSEGSTTAEFVLYQWPTMEKVEMGSPGIPDSRSVYITCVEDPILGPKSPDVLYIWVGRDASGISGHDDGCNDSYIQWQMVGHDFLVRKGLATSSLVQIVREGEEPEQIWKHLHSFTFQNTAEKGDK